MPELPEVETIARQLGPLVAGRRILRCEILDPKLAAVAPGLLTGALFSGVRRSGKQLAFSLEQRQERFQLYVHLRMTGRLVWRESCTDAPLRHLRATLQLDRGCLLFYDPRRFGTLTLAASGEPECAGIDPLAPGFTVKTLRQLLADSNQPLKLWLLRQDRLAGLGNIYASEIMFEAGLHPERRGSSLKPEEAQRLYKSTRAVLRRAIRHCGTTFSDFQDARGLVGRYQNYLRVYGRAGQPCGACGTPVERIVQGQRATFFCPRCQMLESSVTGPGRP